MRHNNTASPVIAITNNQAFYNCRLQSGPMTSSDYNPIIATISYNPIAIPIKPRRQFRKSDWDGYINYLANYDIPTETNPTLKEIDSHINGWTKLIRYATDKFIPTTIYRTLAGIKPNNSRRRRIQYDESIRPLLENRRPEVTTTR